jgi:hypothetical protein
MLATMLALAILELGSIGLVRSGALSVPAPHHGQTGFWRHQHPQFGAWRHPDSEGSHDGACFDVEVRTNSVGARDRERPRRAAEPRVVVLGDSFLEGYGLPERSRLSNQLEADTGIPHLNFAMASFGLYQQLLVYRELARDFDHTAVVASFLPVNDFIDADPELAQKMPLAEYAFRPYLVRGPDGWSRFDYREGALRHWLRLHSQAWNAIYWTVIPSRRSELADHGSWFYAFPDAGLEQVVYLMGELAHAADGRPVVLLLIPAEEDLERFQRDGPDPLSARLAGPARRIGVTLVNLLPAMAEQSRDFAAYFLPCDFHWSHYGNRVAAEIVERELAGVIYPPLAAPAD